ncbi:PepSY-associated TM helix domain-containing protein [Emcibacter nanhaiensis]|uniref:PepSY domain-containing protein n=1 Tax=Emcibacter nanhaiensis TaxID=1505037 RepID=A0A501PTK7_9PROT|nr:PepSY-associated TM helix domain-containing protein [Emcibacter nanhaiensis]TPD63041.1 PepSY domain-containing protein [Emcibacter nanhaiensis]
MRKRIFKLHSYMALAAMLPLLLITLTGALLVFKFEIDALLMPDSVTLDHPDRMRQDMNTLLSTINSAFPDYELGSWELFHDGYEADRIYLIRKGTDEWFKVYFDPFNGQVLSQPVGLYSDFTDWLLQLHYTLLLNDLLENHPLAGLLIVLGAALFMIFLGITGLIIYRKFWRKFFTFDWGPRTSNNMRQLHRLIGIWASPVLLILGITGGYFNLMEYLEEAGEQGAAPSLMTDRLYNDKLDLQTILEDSKKQIEGFHPTYLLMPYEPGLGITFYGEVPSSNPFASGYGSTVTYDSQSGELLHTYDIRDAGFCWNLVDSFRALHFGDFGGLVSKLVWCLVGIGLAGMTLTGFYMWVSRKTGKSRSRKTRAVTPPVSPPSG